MISGNLKKRPVTLNGGLTFTKASTPPITQYPLPSVLHVPTIQHQGSAARVIVEVGDHVNKGQALTASVHLTEVPVHASCCGTVTAIDQSHITIHTDNGNPSRQADHSPQALTRDHLTRLLHEHGLVGLGGAAYPTAKKITYLKERVTALIVNAAECDPLIHCDDALMCEYATFIVSGIKIIAKACMIDRIIIGIEDNKPAAIKRMTDASTHAGLNAEIITVPSVYPSGAEKLLLDLCGIDIARSSYPLATQGVLCLNVATCYSVYQAVKLEMPLISRITTVVDTAGKMRNFDIPIGTPISDIYRTLHQTTELPEDNSIKVRIGGKMMGRPASIFDSTTKSTNCIEFSLTASDTRSPSACIRCGACADICPEQLMPQQLYIFSENFNAVALEKYQLNRCIECACCDIVCPSHIPLTQHFNLAKQQAREKEFASKKAEIAKARYEKREQRLAANIKSKRRQTAASRSKDQALTDKQGKAAIADNKKALIEAALRRKKNKHNPTAPTDDQT